tara:strand:- start:175 stop:336 length:162 start_codon:yes stop_codon:yes gene_type:complete
MRTRKIFSEAQLFGLGVALHFWKLLKVVKPQHSQRRSLFKKVVEQIAGGFGIV